MRYQPITQGDWTAATADLNSDQKRRYLRMRRQGESDALNHASKAEIRKAALSGDPISKVMVEERRDRQQIGGKGWNGFVRACKAEGINAEAACGFNRGGEPAQAVAENTTSSADAKKVAECVEAVVAEKTQELKQEIEDLKANQTRPIEITIPDRPEPVKIDGTHERFSDCLRIASVHQRLLMHGPKGSGKSTIVHNIAKAMGYEDNYAIVSCTAETSINQLLGTRSLRTDEFLPGPVLTTYENGGLLFLDEFDALDPATGVGMNAYLDGGDTAPVEMRTGNMLAKKGKGFLPIIAVNSLTGATRDYSGRMKQDGATMSRFPALVRMFVDYSMQIERNLLAEAAPLAERLWELRDKVRTYNIDGSRMITTRDFAAAAQEVAWRSANPSNGLSDDEIMATIVVDWTDEEKRKVGC